jgi:hypothetical protein
MIKYLIYSTFIIFFFGCITDDSQSNDSGISVKEFMCDETKVTRIVSRPEEGVLLEGYSVYLFEQEKKKVRILINNFPRELGESDSLLSIKITTSQKGNLSSSRYKMIWHNSDSLDNLICTPVLYNKIILMDSNATHIFDAMIPSDILKKEEFRSK